MHTILNQEQLFEISETGKKTILIEWLRDNGIKYKLTRKGKVITSLKAFNDSFEEEVSEVIDFGQE